MPRSLLKRFAAPAICFAVAVTGGLVGGETATQGIRLNSYGIGSAAEASPARMTRTAYDPSEQGGCGDCSERDRGFRWATARGVQAAVDCPEDSWDFQRGCLDFLKTTS